MVEFAITLLLIEARAPAPVVGSVPEAVSLGLLLPPEVEADTVVVPELAETTTVAPLAVALIPVPNSPLVRELARLDARIANVLSFVATVYAR
jgi:hypothetical protein